MATVNDKLTAIADAIRAKTGGTDALTLDGMATAIAGIEGGGGGGNVGGLTQYAKFIEKPASTSEFAIKNPLGGIVRKVCVQRTITDVKTDRKIQQYIVDIDLGIGAMNLVATDGGARYATKPYDSGTGDGKFKVDDGLVTLHRYNGSNTWDANSEYEIEIWQ